MKRLCLLGTAVGLLCALLVLPAEAAPTPPKADPCPPIKKVRYADRLLGSSVEYDPDKKLLTFITPDGRRLEGTNARRIGKRKINVTARSPALTIVMQADLVRGQAQVRATERDEETGASIQSHRLFVLQGGNRIEPCRPTGPLKPPPPTSPPQTSVKPFDPKKFIGQGDHYDCKHFSSQARAQAVLRADARDPNKLDRDRDGIACEDNPAPRDEVKVKRP